MVRPLSEDFSKFCATMEADIQVKTTVFIMTNENFEVTDFSSAAISYFDVNASSLKKESAIQLNKIVWENYLECL